jgi:PPIC-type PPIASE domain
MRKYVAIALLAVVPVACSEPQTIASTGARSPVVARFGDVAITADTIDARILALPATERPKPGEDLDAWYGKQIRELAVEIQLRHEATARKLDVDSEFLAARREAEETMSIQLCLRGLIHEEEIDDETLRGAYEAQRERLAAPERRLVYHIFLRRPSDGSAAEVRQRIESLRDRVLRGESFSRLAAAHSDSESRHRDGALGWITPGQLPGEFNAVIFRLDQHVPSEPVTTPDGFHLFYVDDILPARQPTFGEVRSALRKYLIGERLETALAEIEATTALPAGSVVPDRLGFDAILEAGDQKAVVLSIGETRLTLAALRRQVRLIRPRAPASGAPPFAERAWQLLENLRRKELLFRHCRSTGAVPGDELEVQLTAWQRRTLIALQRHHRLLELARRDDDRLRSFYDGNIGLFSEPPRWHLRRLRLPLGGDASGVMARLEAAAAGTGTDLEALRAKLGGTIDDLGFMSIAALGRLAPKLPPLVAPLVDGALSPPYRTENAIEIAEVVARRDAEPLPFAEVHERAAEAYVAQHKSELYRELADEILQSANLAILPDGLASLREGAMRGPGVSVAQLETLLDEL